MNNATVCTALLQLERSGPLDQVLERVKHWLQRLQEAAVPSVLSTSQQLA
jgi:hypothetical protein